MAMPCEGLKKGENGRYLYPTVQDLVGDGDPEQMKSSSFPCYETNFYLCSSHPGKGRHF